MNQNSDNEYCYALQSVRSGDGRQKAENGPSRAKSVVLSDLVPSGVWPSLATVNASTQAAASRRQGRGSPLRIF